MQNTPIFVHIHPGIGDLFYSIGAIRFLAKHFNEVRVVFSESHKYIFNSLFHDLSNIKQVFTHVNNPYGLYNTYTESHGCMVFLEGLFNPLYDFNNSKYRNFPYEFYDHMGLKRSIIKDYFDIPRLPEYKELWEQMPERYIFLHENSIGGGNYNIFSKLKTDLLVLDPHKNNYTEDHPFYEKAQLVINKPSPVYHIYLIENAEELHIIESCFICLANQLDLSRVKVKKGYPRKEILYPQEYPPSHECDSIKTFGIFESINYFTM